MREIIVCDLGLEADIVFGGEIEVDASYFGSRCKVKQGHCAAGKGSVLGLLKRKGKSTRGLSLMLVQRYWRPLLRRKLCPIASFIPTADEGTTY